ncbi:MAG: penicillin-binding protein 2, partial [candidate division WOR-3 bacterium]|nr:penicillin-binding protein 2 [candidate division WOR-3 bacterium]
ELSRIREIYTPAPRGRIFDRNKIVIADSRPSFALSIIPLEVDSQTIRTLAQYLDIDDSNIKGWLENIAYLRTPIKIKRNLNFDLVLKIEENEQSLPGVLLEVEPTRFYPYGQATAHLVGYLTAVKAEELKQDTFYKPWHFVGRAGIEEQYEKYLRGNEGVRYTEITILGREVGPLKEKREVLPIAGSDVYLTISAELQNFAYEQISKFKKGAVIGIDLTDGGVLCLVSHPSFDPNLITSGISQKDWFNLVNNKYSPLLNRAISCAYPPGSTIKPLIALCGLQSKIINQDTRFSSCLGVFTYGNRTYKCWTKHYSLNLIDAIVFSCNTYFYQLGLKLGLDRITSYLGLWPIKEKTGIDLLNERTGNIPTRQWLDQRYGKNKWTSGIVPNLAIGQGEILVTPLQLATIYSAIAKDGEYYSPHLVQSIKRGDSTIYRYPLKKNRLPVALDDLKIIKKALQGVVAYGTGASAQMPGIAVCGKTGTAENPPNVDHAWFVGYAPAENPDVVFC